MVWIEHTKWASAYDLEILEFICYKCGKKLKTVIPMISDMYACLYCGTCSCGNKDTGMVMTSIH